MKGKKVAFINNELDINLDQLNKNLKEFQMTLISHQDLQLHIKRREDVLVIIKDDANEKNKVISFYPFCTFAQLNRIAKTMQNGNELKGMIRQHIRITKGWNLVGSIIAMPLILSAPLINLFGDALTLTFMSRVKRWSERIFIASTHQIQAEELTSDKVLWHSKQTSDILDFFHIDAFHGLSNVQANDALQIYGKNQLV